MSDTHNARLQALGITLPKPAAPLANYVPSVRSGALLFISGQLPMENGKITCIGKVGANVTIEAAQQAAKLCAINVLAQAQNALEGDLERILRCVKLGGFVAGSAEFTQQPSVINGASDLMVAVLGDAGRHARFAVGVPSLPFDAAVEIEAVFEVR